MSSTAITARENDAAIYLNSHNIMNILNDLTASLVYYQPENPREFLISELKKLRSAKVSEVNTPTLLNRKNAEAMFGILDPVGRGYITCDQYMTTMRQIGAVQYDSFTPDVNDQITLDVFLKQFP